MTGTPEPDPQEPSPSLPLGRAAVSRDAPQQEGADWLPGWSPPGWRLPAAPSVDDVSAPEAPPPSWEPPPTRGDPTRPGAREPFGPRPLATVLSGLYCAWAFALAFSGQPVLGPLSGLVLLEISLLGYRVLAMRGRVLDDPTLVARVDRPLRELCLRAGTAPPRVVVLSDGLRAMAVGRRKGQVLLIASARFLEGIDDRALRGVVAHEVAHLRRADLAVARATRLAVMLAGFVIVFLLGRPGPSLLDMPIYSATFAVVVIICALVLSPLQRRRELRADMYGAQLSGDPLALSSALTAATRFRDEARSRFYGIGAWQWLLWPMSWRVPSRPSIEKRQAALARLSGPATD